MTKEIILGIIFMLLITFTIGFLSFQLIEAELKYEASQELLIFELEYVVWLLEQNNLTIEETMDDFIRYKTEELINDTTR